TVNQVADAAGGIRKLDIDIQGYEGQLAVLTAARDAEPRFLTAPVTTTNSSIDPLKERIASLKVQAKSLLVLYKPNHTKVQEIQAQIDELEKRLARMPLVVTNVTRSPNPALVTYDAKIADVRAALSAGK